MTTPMTDFGIYRESPPQIPGLGWRWHCPICYSNGFSHSSRAARSAAELHLQQHVEARDIEHCADCGHTSPADMPELAKHECLELPL